MTVASPSRRRGRWFLAAYVLLLLASHAVRRLDPVREAPDSDERVITVHAVEHDAELSTPVQIAFRDQGPPDRPDAPTLVLLHGSPGDNGAFWSLIPTLANEYRVVAPDLPGFGGSTHDIPDYAFAAHAHYLRQLLDSLHIQSAHIVGFSMGGGVALDFAEQAPDRVRSITLLSSIGAQEYELAGDYYLNHAIHGLQLAGLWALKELTPQFGYFDDAMLSVEYARNFYDSDQRPLRAILSHYQGPMLILHGERDPLVMPAAAREHARLVPQSELVMYSGDHFMVFMHPEMIETPLRAFLERVDKGEALTRTTATPERVHQAALPFDPRSVPNAEGLARIILCLLIALATLLSEDLACIATGLLVARGMIGFWPGAIACFVGIFVGDVLLFLSGRWLGRRVLFRAPLRWFLKPEDVERSSQWFQRQGAAIVFATRVIPGTRLPTYFAAGMLRTDFRRFALYFFIACALWTPVLVGLSAAYGESLQMLLGEVRSRMWTWLAVSAGFLLFLLHLLIPMLSWRGRRLLLGRWRRLTRWEFWPRWAFYPPVVLYIGYLALKHRGLTLLTAVNPGIPGGGLVGESKGDILAALSGHPDFVARTERLPATVPLNERLLRLRQFQQKSKVRFPVVLKPDIGERGTGVAVIRSETEASEYLETAACDLLMQEYAPGFEFGVFYFRRPEEESGSIFSVTEKRFPSVTGDGRRTLESLILADDRAVCMAPFHLRKHATQLSRIPEAGESVQLVELGTHSRGALFLDGGWVVSPELRVAIDRVSQSFRGFYFGRYDIRTPSIDDFRAGRNLKIVELNGATAEATSIYDPKNSLTSAYRTLFAQWRILFEIAAANVRRGAKPAPWGELLGLVGKWLNG